MHFNPLSLLFITYPEWQNVGRIKNQIYKTNLVKKNTSQEIAQDFVSEKRKVKKDNTRKVSSVE